MKTIDSNALASVTGGADSSAGSDSNTEPSIATCPVYNPNKFAVGLRTAYGKYTVAPREILHVGAGEYFWSAAHPSQRAVCYPSGREFTLGPDRKIIGQ